jgi:hypothetical protein
MSQVIIYANKNGGVAITFPTGELPIDEVLAKDCPEGAIIVDDSALPQGDDANYFDAWELINGQVTVNQTKKEAIINAKQASETAKTTAQNKLAALGLTTDEIKAILGTTS